MDLIKKHYRLLLLSIPIISLALHFHVLNVDLVGIHVWRQTETQSVINNFYREDMNILNAKVNNYVFRNRNFKLEFPILEWIYAVFYKILGPHIAISRVLTFILGLFSVYGMFYLCNTVFKNKPLAAICAWCFNFSPLFYYYTINPLPDNMGLCCGIWCIAFFYSYVNSKKIIYLPLSALFLCLAALIKLPFILYGSFIFTYLLFQISYKEISRKQIIQVIAIFFIFSVPALAWYLFVIPEFWHGMLVIKGITGVQFTASEAFDWLWGNAVSTLPELLVNYGSVLFFIFGFYYMLRNKTYKKKNFTMFLVWGLSIIGYFLYELNVICLVHDYYLLPFLPPIFLLVAYGAYNLLSGANKYGSGLAVICLLILPLTAFLRVDGRWDTKEPNFNPAYFQYKHEIRKLIPENELVIAGNDESEQISLYYIDRRGWTFEKDQLNDAKIRDYMGKGAKYLFVDSHIDESPEVIAHLDQKIFDKETLRVYKLK